MEPIENTQLAEIVKVNQLENNKAEMLLQNFQDFFLIAADWEAKAQMIVVTDASQHAEMQMARAGRLFLKEKRVEVEKKRKELKESALREGKAIDGVANVLKALIVPIEEYLDQQEHFVEIRQAAIDEQLRIEAAAKDEEERIAAEKAEAEERERIRLENERLKSEAEEKERTLAVERAEAAAKLKAVEDAAAKERLEIWAETDRKNTEALAEAARLKDENDRKLEAERSEKQALADRLAAEVECPFCHKKFIPGKVER